MNRYYVVIFGTVIVALLLFVSLIVSSKRLRECDPHTVRIIPVDVGNKTLASVQDKDGVCKLNN